MTAKEIYDRAVRQAREAHARAVDAFLAGDLVICPCGLDMERRAIIRAFSREMTSSDTRSPRGVR